MFSRPIDPPRQLRGFSSELVARLSGGLVCEIEPADHDTRIGLLRRFAAEQQVDVPDDVLRLIAGRFTGDARPLRGVINRLAAASDAYQQPVTLPFAEKTLYDLLRSSQPVIQISEIDAAVCDMFGFGG